MVRSLSARPERPMEHALLTAAPLFSTVFGTAGIGLCLVNYVLLRWRHDDGRGWLFLLLNHIALAAMSTGLTVSHGAGLAPVLVLWASVAVLAVVTFRRSGRRGVIERGPPVQIHPMMSPLTK